MLLCSFGTLSANPELLLVLQIGQSTTKFPKPDNIKKKNPKNNLIHLSNSPVCSQSTLIWIIYRFRKEETDDVPNTRKAFRQQICVMLTQSQLNKNNKKFSKV